MHFSKSINGAIFYTVLYGMVLFCCNITIGENYLGKSLILDKVMQLCRGKELQPFPSLYSPFLPFLICQPSIDSLPSLPLRSPSLSTLPSSYVPLLLPFPVPSVQFPIFLFPFQPSSIPWNLPLSIPTFPVPTFSLPYLSLSQPISFPAYPHPSLPPSYLSHYSLFIAVTLPIFLYFYLPLFLSFSPFYFPFFFYLFLPFPSPKEGKRILYTPNGFIRFETSKNFLSLKWLNPRKREKFSHSKKHYKNKL